MPHHGRQELPTESRARLRLTKRVGLPRMIRLEPAGRSRLALRKFWLDANKTGDRSNTPIAGPVRTLRIVERLPGTISPCDASEIHPANTG